MAGQTSGKARATTGRNVTDTARTDQPTETSVAATGPTSPTVQSSPPSRPAPSPRVAVDVNVETIRTAFATGDASQSVGFVQHMLRSRGFEPGNTAGIADHDTRVAYARYQESINEAPTGLPTASSLDYLGFDVVG